MSASKFIECVTVGDGAVGRTCMLISCTNSSFPMCKCSGRWKHCQLRCVESCRPRGLEQIQITELSLCRCFCSVLLINQAMKMWQKRQEETEIAQSSFFIYNLQFRIRYFSDDSIFLSGLLYIFAFRWIPELKHYATGVPLVLVGTKLDLRDDTQFFIDHPSAVPVSTAQNIKAVLDATISTPTTKAVQKQEVPRAAPYCKNFLQTKKEHAINQGSI